MTYENGRGSDMNDLEVQKAIEALLVQFELDDLQREGRRVPHISPAALAYELTHLKKVSDEPSGDNQTKSPSPAETWLSIANLE